MPPFYGHKLRLAYSKVEEVQHADRLRHSVAREALRLLEIESGLEIHHLGDLPSRSGLGSSASFAVGLLNAICGLKEVESTPYEIVRAAYCIERDMLSQITGKQDQVQAAYGGLNRIIFSGAGMPHVEPITHLDDFESYMMLFYTGAQRFSADITATYEFKPKAIRRMMEMVNIGVGCLQNGKIVEFAELLHESWGLKKQLSSRISDPFIDELYERARKSGAIGGKIIGAGGGGFLFLMAGPEAQEKIKAELKECVYVPFKFVEKGSEVIYDSRKVQGT